jgi:serine/threonine protein kinase
LPPELSFRRDVRSRFLREAETAAQLSHPNIVPIYSVDEVGNLVFFVMACIDGDNLGTLVQKRGPLPIDNVRRWLRKCPMRWPMRTRVAWCIATSSRTTSCSMASTGARW